MLRSNLVLTTLGYLVRQHPKFSLGVAFELGILAAVAYRRRRRVAGAAAKLVEAVPLIDVPPRKRKRKVAGRKTRARPAKTAPQAGAA